MTLLKSRASLLKQVRTFFDDRGFLEVDTPLLSPYPPIDTHIEIFEVEEKLYLHSSPEYGMKCLLARGSGNIYQLGHVYRKDERGRLHSPEFTMIEWYRIETNFHEFLHETLELCTLFVGGKPHETITYSEAFERHLALDPSAPLTALSALAGREGTREELLNFLWGASIEPHLGREGWTVVTAYPKEQAALAQIKNGYAERFEIYLNGVELGNGYHELTDPIEQRERLERANRERSTLGKKPLPIDPNLLRALEKGLPDCYGIAMGFDRLLMLHLGASSLSEIIPL
ncbi:MAG: Elongation factor P--(R)-beta-lysine ligase [Chlamydiae bacterium]|nr:Elongation factor P--(R)-beta-lysine ligase [Chlamydiota bacterium]